MFVSKEALFFCASALTSATAAAPVLGLLEEGRKVFLKTKTASMILLTPFHITTKSTGWCGVVVSLLKMTCQKILDII